MSRHWPRALLWLRVCTDLTPERRIYTTSPPVHRSSHDIVCQWYTVPCTSSARTVTVCRVILYAPGRASFPKPRSKAPFQSYDLTPGGILTPVLRPCRPRKISARQVHEFPSRLRLPCLQRADIPTASVLSFISWLRVLPPAGYILCVLMSMGY